MLEPIRTAIQALARERGDHRLHVFDVQAAEKGGRIQLSGTVLEESDLQALVEALSRKLHSARVDASQVQVLRRSENLVLAVGTNLTSLHREPSFRAEQLTQLVNGMHVELLIEAGLWSFVRQTDGYLGWTYRPYLTNASHREATHLLVAPLAQMRARPETDAQVLTTVLAGTALHATGPSSDWTEVELAGGLRGWLPAGVLRPLNQLASTSEQRRTQMMLDAPQMTGTPYLWGGTSAYGIDCSGFAQLLHLWVGVALPRDADMQCDAGRPLEPPFRPGDLLFFGDRGAERRATHVGVSVGEWRIIHSSRARNGVYLDDVQAVEHLREGFLQASSFLES